MKAHKHSSNTVVVLFVTFLHQGNEPTESKVSKWPHLAGKRTLRICADVDLFVFSLLETSSTDLNKSSGVV